MKKTTSKLLSLLLALTLVLSLAACGGGGSSETTDLTGTTWALSGGSQGDTEVDKATLEGLLGGEMTYSFEADGKLVMALNGVEVEGTWSQDGSTVTVDVQGDTGTMTLNGDKLTIEESGVTVEFTQK